MFGNCGIKATLQFSSTLHKICPLQKVVPPLLVTSQTKFDATPENLQNCSEFFCPESTVSEIYSIKSSSKSISVICTTSNKFPVNQSSKATITTHKYKDNQQQQLQNEGDNQQQQWHEGSNRKTSH